MKTVLHKRILFSLLLLLSPTLLFSKDSLTPDITALSQTKQWHRLLHFKNGESEIDDPAFFFSKEGKTNPTAELKATIQQLILDKSDDENSTLCYYPSRSHWILEKIPQLNREIYHPQCTELKKELKTLGANYVTVILASAHINSPASAFGHTFLRIDNNPKTPLLSYSVNYAAQTTEENGLIYAYQGIFGGYEGRYSVAPYYEKLKSYSDLEQRDIWEYKLDLTPEEIAKMVRHIFEIRHFYADYFFLAENCSYNLLWLLEVAKEDLNLTDQFQHKAIPIDTIRAIRDAQLIAKTTYRPSKRKKILNLSEPIKNNPTALTFAKSKEHNLSLLKGLNREEKIATLELATALLQIAYAENEIPKEEYLPKFLALLKVRSRLGTVEKRPINEPIPPSESHKTAKTTLSYTSDQRLKLATKVSYHDIYDNDAGFVSGAYIDFLDTTIAYQDNRVKLEEINLLNIQSYSLQESIFKPISWEVSTGGKRIFNDELHAYLKAGMGVTLGNKTLYGYTTITPTLYYKKSEEVSLSANMGLLYNPSKDLKLGLLGRYEAFNHQRKIEHLEPFITYSIDPTKAININGLYEKKNKREEREVSLSLFWYY